MNADDYYRIRNKAITIKLYHTYEKITYRSIKSQMYLSLMENLT